MMWLYAKNNPDKMISVKISLFFSKLCLPIFEKKFPNDKRPRACVEAIEGWLKEPNEGNRQSCEKAARAAEAASLSDGKAANAARAASDAAWAVSDSAYPAYWAKEATYWASKSIEAAYSELYQRITSKNRN